MDTEKSSQEQDIEKILFDGLNEHGFVFQEKCAKELRENTFNTLWQVEKTEYPVYTGLKNTRIDIVLKDTKRYSPQNNHIYAIVECKRVNPSRCYWIFGKPVDTRNRQVLVLLLQSIKIVDIVPSGSIEKGGYAKKWSKADCTFDIISPLTDNWWLQITKKSGNKYDSSPQPIEDSFLQVCVGVSGIAREIGKRVLYDHNEYSVIFIPIVITTAPIYYAEYDLDNVDLETGIINKDKVSFHELDGKKRIIKWIKINYPVNFDVFSEDINVFSKIDDFSWLKKDYQNSIYVVNSNYIVEFFSKLHLW